MSASGDPAKRAAREAARIAAKTELAQIDLSDEETADAIGTVMLSVVRDLAVSSFYGKTWHAGGTLPTLTDVFSQACAAHVEQEIQGLKAVQNLGFPVYGNMGDARGMLARLLVCCRDIDQLRLLVSAADARIAALGADVTHMADGQFVRHLRNAVLHSHFKVLVDQQDPFMSKFVFIDVHAGELTAKIVLSNNQLVEVMRIIVALPSCGGDERRAGVSVAAWRERSRPSGSVATKHTVPKDLDVVRAYGAHGCALPSRTCLLLALRSARRPGCLACDRCGVRRGRRSADCVGRVSAGTDGLSGVRGDRL